ncbi:nonribosomal peptide synthase [Penicillium fimorum]|uniref:Nonribosomal peptide synthase n=1 Tax=Penicillium fimorum TaxID=1882269 RepID=A0A9W9XTB8_9EURO|nr:nonribosomal peptide synthase [Penicillium fimorum]
MADDRARDGRDSAMKSEELCIQRLLEDLLDLYHGKDVVVSAEFAKYVRHCRDHESEAFGFWKSLLMGADMTPPILPKELSVTCEPSIIESVQQFQFHKTNDVVFGQLVVSRNTDVDELDQVVGPCINRIPVCVQMVAGKSPLRFLERIQQRHADSLQFDRP